MQRERRRARVPCALLMCFPIAAPACRGCRDEFALHIRVQAAPPMAGAGRYFAGGAPPAAGAAFFSAALGSGSG
jgi:hypothetical protein